MKTKTLLILAGAGVLAWWLWKRNRGVSIGVPDLLRAPAAYVFGDDGSQFVPGSLAPGAARSPIFPRSSVVNSGEADASPVAPFVDRLRSAPQIFQSDAPDLPTPWLAGA